MWDRLRSIWAAPDLRKKILITLGILVLYRLISIIPVPGISPSAVSNTLGNNSNLSQLFGLLSVFSGGSIQNFSIVSLGVYPYITASIVVQLLQPIIPALDRLAKDGGEAGRNQLSQITRYLTVPLAFLQGFGQIVLFTNLGVVSSDQFNLLNGKTFVPTLTTLMVMTTGVLLLVWLGELITENGIGNGISLIIFVNIVAQLIPSLGKYLLGSGVGSSSPSTSSSTLGIVVFAAVVIALIALIVIVTLADRRIPVQYPTKRMVGRRALMESRQSTYIPIKINQGGMIPLIFAQSMLLFPVILATYLAVPSNKITWLRDAFQWIQRTLDPTTTLYGILFFAFIVGFTYFYATILWEQQNTADNLRKQGAFVAGVRPGNDTNTYLYKILMRVTLWGALFLALIAIAPYVIPGFRASRGGGGSSNGLLTAASLIIIVQVAMDTVKQIQSHLVMRNYSGFLR
jgi:preprotein translocase subunit SecY